MKAIILFLATFSMFSLAAQQEIEEGKTYEQSTSLKVSSIGTSFTIPPGWRGMLPQGSQAFVMAFADNSASIFLTAEPSGNINPSTDLNTDIPLDQGIVLVPTGTAGNTGGVWKNSYSVQGAPQPLNGYAEVKEGKNGYTVGAILLAMPEQFEKRKNDVTQLIKSVSFSQPQQTSSSSSGGQEWSAYLKGRALKYFYNESGFSSTDFIFLCSDGSFSRTSSDVSNSSLGTGSARGGGQGRWEARGKGNQGSLLLYYNDGRHATLQIQYGEGNKGQGIYLDGSRYYVDANEQCR